MHLESIEYELMDFGTEISCSKTFCPANATSHGILLHGSQYLKISHEKEKVYV